MHWLDHLTNFFTPGALRKSLKREPLYLDMLGYGLGAGAITMISIGSSDGVECLYALKHKGKDVTVHLLEPDPDNLAVCKKNLSAYTLDNQVRFHPLAASNRNASGFFYRNPEAPNLNSATEHSGTSIQLPVAYITLSHFITEQGIATPLIINMDIEGHEVEVLEGFADFARNHHNIRILMEVHPERYTETHSLEKILRQYFSMGFKVAYAESAGLPVPDKFRNKGLRPVKIAKHRALYQNLDNEFILDAACYENINVVDNHGRVTRKIVRSLLLEKT